MYENNDQLQKSSHRLLSTHPHKMQMIISDNFLLFKAFYYLVLHAGFLNYYFCLHAQIHPEGLSFMRNRHLSFFNYD